MSIIKKNSFETKYPMFVTVITDEQIRKNMLANPDLLEKCTELSSSITFFINELELHFDNETVLDIIYNSVFKYPTEILKEFITAYLNSELSVKGNLDIVKYYNKILHYGPDCIKYVSKNGIITNSKRYNNLPNEVIDEMFDSIVTDEYSFNDEKIVTYKYRLNTDEKKYIIELIENNCWDYICTAFSSFNTCLFIILSLVFKSRINKVILNENVKNILSEDVFYTLVKQIIEACDSRIVYNVSELVNMDKYNEIKYLVKTDNIRNLCYIDPLLIAGMSLDQILDVIEKKNKVLTKEDV